MMWIRVWMLLVLCLAQWAYGGQLLLSAGGMGFMNSSKQGGSGPEGSTILTHYDLVYQMQWFGVGAWGQIDFQGSSEKDFLVGPKLELKWSVFYLEGGYAPFLNRSFSDRSIAEQTGYGFLTGVGARFPLGAASGSSGGGGFFLQFTYKYRIQVIKKQDGLALDQPIIQKDGYPIFGIGYQF